MTPYYVENPTLPHRPMVKVPYDIVRYCDDFTVDADREDLRYVDCVWMHLGYYGTPASIMKEVRKEWEKSPPVRPAFE